MKGIIASYEEGTTGISKERQQTKHKGLILTVGQHDEHSSSFFSSFE